MIMVLHYSIVIADRPLFAATSYQMNVVSLVIGSRKHCSSGQVHETLLHLQAGKNGSWSANSRHHVLYLIQKCNYLYLPLANLPQIEV